MVMLSYPAAAQRAMLGSSPQTKSRLKASMLRTKVVRLQRPRHPMPASIRKALISSGLMAAYRLRPAYQRNDYLGWIERARLGTTRQRRLEQMLEELARGDRYMKMAWRPPTARAAHRSRSKMRTIR
jgi:hypothetical protein